MNFYWIYDLGNLQMFALIVLTFVVLSTFGAFLSDRYLETFLGLSEKTNDTINHFLSVSGVFYGITLGLIAVGTFDNYNSVQRIVEEEASSLAALYRNTGMLEQKKTAENLRYILKDYTQFVIEKAWALQRQGIVPQDASNHIDTYFSILKAYIPSSEKDRIVYQEVLDRGNNMLENRRLRMAKVPQGLPSAIWLVLFFGAFVILVMTWLLVIPQKNLDLLINTFSGALLGSLIFLIVAMDNPFRGEFSVSPSPFELLLTSMKKS